MNIIEYLVDKLVTFVAKGLDSILNSLAEFIAVHPIIMYFVLVALNASAVVIDYFFPDFFSIFPDFLPATLLFAALGTMYSIGMYYIFKTISSQSPSTPVKRQNDLNTLTFKTLTLILVFLVEIFPAANLQDFYGLALRLLLINLSYEVIDSYFEYLEEYSIIEKHDNYGYVNQEKSISNKIKEIYSEEIEKEKAIESEVIDAKSKGNGSD